MKKRKLFLLITICLIVIIIGLIFLIMPYYKEAKRVHNMITGLDELKELEIDFQKKPTIDKCIRILNYNSSLNLKRYNERIKLAEKCINLGSDNHKYGWLIRLRIAEIYRGLGKKDKAYEQIQIAKKIDKNNQIEKMKWLERLKLKNLN